MLSILSWFLILSLFALWSLTVWAANVIALWALANAGAWTGAASGAAGLALPDWLAPWVPLRLAQALTAMLDGVVPMVDRLIQSAPSLAGGITVAAWVVWALGSVMLILLGAGLHVLIALWRRRRGHSHAQPTQQIAARRRGPPV
ncbi:MAG: hypothetical protein H7224_10870 [Polaromonas sp.]|nr:hypothetical protein [Polaromonas sp.]